MRAKRSLGQNFLVDENAIARIVELVPPESDIVLEIGPGQGALTYALAPRAHQLCLLEKDEELLAATRTRLQLEGFTEVTTWADDALEFNFKEIWREFGADRQLTVVSNLPYNVATEIMFRLLEHADRIERMVLMFQKEVGTRLAAAPDSKAYGAISIMVQLLFAVKREFVLPPTAFRPRPRVESAVLSFERLEQPVHNMDTVQLAKFRQFLDAAFRHRRKTLENGLSMGGAALGWDLSRGRIAATLQEMGLPAKVRAENLSIGQFLDLFYRLSGIGLAATE